MRPFIGDLNRFTGPLDVVSLDEIAGEIRCIDCDGTGDVSWVLPEPDRGHCPCVTCKGTGRALISL